MVFSTSIWRSLSNKNFGIIAKNLLSDLHKPYS